MTKPVCMNMEEVGSHPFTRFVPTEKESFYYMQK